MNDDATTLNPTPSSPGSRAPGLVADEVRVLADDPALHSLDLIEEAGSAWAVAWPGVGSHLRSMHRISLVAGGATRRQFHPMEAVYYVISGEPTVEDLDDAATRPLTTGSMVFVEPMTAYRFVAGASGAELVGGPCPPDPGLYRHLQGG